MTIDLTFWLGMALILSLVANGFAAWYISKLLKKFLFISENLNDLKTHRMHPEENGIKDLLKIVEEMKAK